MSSLRASGAGALLRRVAYTQPMTIPMSVSSLAAAAAVTLPRATTHSYHSTRPTQLPYKDDQNRDSLKPRSTEGTGSGKDGDVAAHEDAAFNPRKTDPGEAKKTAAKGGDGDPLEVSGANQELSKPQGDSGAKEKSAGKGEGKKKKSQSGGR